MPISSLEISAWQVWAGLQRVPGKRLLVRARPRIGIRGANQADREASSSGPAEMSSPDGVIAVVDLSIAVSVGRKACRDLVYDFRQTT